MLKCVDCKRTFEEEEVSRWEERHGFDWGMSEEFFCCPYCDGAFEEAELCDDCGEYFLHSELYNGVCAECLIESINYDDFLEILIEDDFLDVFMFNVVFECEEPTEPSEKLLAELREIFLRRKTDDMICGKTEFLDLCKKFVREGRFIGVSEYAEWLEYKEVKK